MPHDASRLARAQGCLLGQLAGEASQAGPGPWRCRIFVRRGSMLFKPVAVGSGRDVCGIRIPMGSVAFSGTQPCIRRQIRTDGMKER